MVVERFGINGVEYPMDRMESSLTLRENVTPRAGDVGIEDVGDEDMGVEDERWSDLGQMAGMGAEQTRAVTTVKGESAIGLITSAVDGPKAFYREHVEGKTTLTGPEGNARREGVSRLMAADILAHLRTEENLGREVLSIRLEGTPPVRRRVEPGARNSELSPFQVEAMDRANDWIIALEKDIAAAVRARLAAEIQVTGKYNAYEKSGFPMGSGHLPPRELTVADVAAALRIELEWLSATNVNVHVGKAVPTTPGDQIQLDSLSWRTA